MPFSRFALVLATLIAAIGVGELVYFSDGYLPRQWLVIALWVVIPVLFAYWLAARFFRSTAAATIVCAALALALALGVFGAWDVTLGPGRNESLNGLVVVGVPAYQYALLAVSWVIAWIIDRRAKSASAGR